MTEQLKALVETLARPGSETSEAKKHRWGMIFLVLVIVGEIAVQVLQKSASYGHIAVIVTALAAAVKQSKDYAVARSEVKGKIADLLGNETVAALLRDTLTPRQPVQSPPAVPASGAASPFVAAAAAIPLTPRKLRPRSRQTK